MNSRGNAVGFERLASTLAWSSVGSRSNSSQNLSAAFRARASDRQTPKMIAQLSSDSSASTTSTNCVTVVELSTRSSGLVGTAPRET
jgi:hypothetical protein